MKHLKTDILYSGHSGSCESPVFRLDNDLPGGAGYGFGGAEVIGLENLLENGHPCDVVFFGIDKELSRQYGNHNRGAASFVRKRTFTMAPWTQANAPDCRDIGILTAEDPENAMWAIRLISRQLTKLGLKPVFIGCDHTASIAVFTGVTEGRKEPLSYLFLDAHYDLGLHNKTVGLHNGNFVDCLRRTANIGHVVNVGGRCLSGSVPVYHSVPGFTFIPCDHDRTSGETMIDVLEWLRGAPLYVSIDADVLDPSFAPNVSCPEPFGITSHELLAICKWIGKNCDVVGADLCEIIPLHHSQQSERALMHCLLALFPKNETASSKI